MKRPEEKRDCLLLTQRAGPFALGQINICAISCVSSMAKRPYLYLFNEYVTRIYKKNILSIS
ncbi:hypothetical protein, partial [Enterobacter hormaechei]